MNAAQVHLMTAHLPVVGVPFAAILLLAGIVGKSHTLWLTSCWALVATMILAAFPYFSGPSAYSWLAERPEIEPSLVESHAIVARGASLGLVVLGALALSAILREWQGEVGGRIFKVLLLVGAILISYALGWSAHLGGLIRHPELSQPSLPMFPPID